MMDIRARISVADLDKSHLFLVDCLLFFRWVNQRSPARYPKVTRCHISGMVLILLSPIYFDKISVYLFLVFELGPEPTYDFLLILAIQLFHSNRKTHLEISNIGLWNYFYFL